MVFNFRSRDQPLRRSFLGCFAVGVDLELPAGPALARLLHCEITPSPCTVLVRRRSLCAGWMYALRRFFFPARWQQRLIPSTSVSGTLHSSPEEVASLSTLWKARYGLVVVLATHTCPRGCRGQRSHWGWGAWKTLKEQAQFHHSVSVLLIAVVAMTHGHTLLLQEMKQYRWRGNKGFSPLLCTDLVPKTQSLRFQHTPFQAFKNNAWL